MPRWIFEPRHSAAAFAVRHMMVSQMRGIIKNVRGTIEFDPDEPTHAATVEATLDAAGIWTGDDARDAHLRGADFQVTGDLDLRGVTRPVVLWAHYLGRWQCPYWEGGRDLGPTTRIGFTASTAINRHGFGVSWNAPLDRGGVVAGDEVAILLDVEAILDAGMQRIAAALAQS